MVDLKRALINAANEWFLSGARATTAGQWRRWGRGGGRRPSGRDGGRPAMPVVNRLVGGREAEQRGLTQRAAPELEAPARQTIVSESTRDAERRHARQVDGV